MVSVAYKEQRRLMVVTEARQAEGGSGHRMVIAANEVSRNGDELNLRGISFKNYRKNPVVLWAHDSYSGIPIAKTVKIGHDDQGRIVADFEFQLRRRVCGPCGERLERGIHTSRLDLVQAHQGG